MRSQRTAHHQRWLKRGLIFSALLALLALLSQHTWQASANESTQATPPGASVRVKVEVPPDMRSAPFDVDRYLNVPPNFSVAVYARVSGARFMAVTPDGNLLVSQPGDINSSDPNQNGRITLVRPQAGGGVAVSEFASGMRKPHDMVFTTIGGTTYLYVSESHQVVRAVYTPGQTTIGQREVIIGNLPDNSSGELKGRYGHALKNFAISGGKLYLSIASSCNACVEDTVSDPVRGAIYEYNMDGTGKRLFAQGLRNAEGLAVVPNSNDLWAVVNNRDNIGYPYQNDFDGDGSNDYGKVMQAYVDNHPPEPFTRVADGGNYGWPFCKPNPDNGLDNMPYDRDVQLNADGSKLDCNAIPRINKGIQAHSAPLGLSFWTGSDAPAAYRNGAVTGLHGSWNRSTKTGYKFIFFPWDTATNGPGPQVDLVTGWLDDATQGVWGRPVDAVPDAQGNLFLSDDSSGTIYKLTYTGTPQPTATPVQPTATPVQPTATPVQPTATSVPPTPTATQPAGGPIANGTYKVTVVNSGKVLDVSGQSQDDGALVQQWEDVGGLNQQWQVEALGDGTYRFTAKHSGKVLDVKYAGTGDGTPIWQWPWNGSCAQRWRIEPLSGGAYTIRSACSTKVLDVQYSRLDNGAPVQLWEANGTATQQWRFTQVP
ncbi:MAG: RICIN domain-containing protein [Chloroflexaceae bacterium]|nr:RICIN domain-containing protein [Chloroflexaceae bacterium]